MLQRYPFYIRATVILFGLVLLVYVLFNLADILIPLAFSLMLAILLNPLTVFFETKCHLPHVAAISLAIISAILFIAGLGFLLYTQVMRFSDQLPVFEQKLSAIGDKTQAFLSQHFNISIQKQRQYIQEGETALKPVLASTAGTILGGLSAVILVPVYTFLFLFYKKLLLNFFYEVFAEENEQDVSKVLTQTKGAIQSYMLGLLLEAIAVATLNSIALLILGVNYAILLGVIGALLNVLPFIGGILAVIPPILIATVTKEGIHTQVEIIIAYMIIQFIDNHFLVPYIVSSKVKINALVSIVIVFMGGALWGVAGMFLSIPFIGVLKTIFDRLPSLKPWGKLLGTEVPTQRRQPLREIGDKMKRRPIKKHNPIH
jgi:predicted PurR-regulated permease PerM